MARAQADPRGLVRAVNQIARPLQVKGMAPERIVRAGTDDPVELLAVLAVLLDHGDGHRPGRILLAPHDLGDALGGGPADLADADGVRDDDLGLAGLVRREVEQPHGGDVDDHSLAGSVRQNELGGQDDLSVGARQPGIHSGIGPDDFFVPDVEAARDVGERVLLRCFRGLHRADNVLARSELEPLRLDRRGRGRHHGRGRRRWRLVVRGLEQSAGGDGQGQESRHTGPDARGSANRYAIGHARRERGANSGSLEVHGLKDIGHLAARKTRPRRSTKAEPVDSAAHWHPVAPAENAAPAAGRQHEPP